MPKRLFIAIKPSQITLTSINAFQANLREKLHYRGIRWVRPELMHLTLLFMGDVDESLIPKISASLKTVSTESKAYDLLFNGTGFFGHPEELRTIWIGSHDSGETEKLFSSIYGSLKRFIQIDKRRLTPHLTLARISDYVPKEDRRFISETINHHKETSFGSSNINKLELIESTLTPAGPIYRTLEQFFLR